MVNKPPSSEGHRSKSIQQQKLHLGKNKNKNKQTNKTQPDRPVHTKLGGLRERAERDELNMTKMHCSKF